MSITSEPPSFFIRFDSNNAASISDDGTFFHYQIHMHDQPSHDKFSAKAAAFAKHRQELAHAINLLLHPLTTDS